MYGLLCVCFVLSDLASRFLALLKTPSLTPRPYGLTHLIALALTVLLVYFLWTRRRDASDSQVRRTVRLVWLVMLVLELYKQVVFSFHLSAEGIVFAYEWGAFPFQLCSTPLYVLPLVAFLPEGRLRRSLLSYSASYALVGGLAVLLYPASVFTDVLGINLQTMLHHLLQCVIGVYLGMRYRRELSWRHFLLGTLPFLSLLSIAVWLNEWVHRYLVGVGSDAHFNLFFVSPYYDGPLDFVNAWQGRMPPTLFVLLYALGLTLAAALVFFAVRRAAFALETKKSRSERIPLCY